jgi:hypothetical protein
MPEDSVTDTQATPPADADAPATPAPTLAARFDRWVAANPWHPRILPLMAYIVLLAPVAWLRDWQPWTFPIAYTLQCGLVVGLLWRFRRLLPEMTATFHLSAALVGSVVFVVWMVLGYAIMDAAPATFGAAGYDYFARMPDGLAWMSMALRLAGMAIVVPLFEELFHRSLTLRSFHGFRKTGIGLMNLAQDLPVLDELIRNHDLSKRAAKHDAVFADQFNRVPLGRLSVFGVAASTFVFMLAHGMRDWPACVFCGVAYCGVVWWTNRSGKRMGLGPAIWAHAITNAQIWLFTLATHLMGAGDWRFFA